MYFSFNLINFHKILNIILIYCMFQIVLEEKKKNSKDNLKRVEIK